MMDVERKLRSLGGLVITPRALEGFQINVAGGIVLVFERKLYPSNKLQIRFIVPAAVNMHRLTREEVAELVERLA